MSAAIGVVVCLALVVGLVYALRTSDAIAAKPKPEPVPLPVPPLVMPRDRFARLSSPAPKSSVTEPKTERDDADTKVIKLPRRKPGTKRKKKARGGK